MGTVFIGEHILLGRQAAIKTLVPTLAVQSDVVERFFREARATSSISDPGVVQVFDFGYHVDGTPYIVMELLEGEALSARLDRLGTLPPLEALRIARQIASALGAAHALNIVHRDLKPDNVFLVRDAEAPGGERAKIFDFGICKSDRDTETPTRSGVVLGTPVYMSPEQCQGAGSVDHRCDIYSLGCVLFHMLTGRAPFECEGAGEFIVAHMQQIAPAPSAFVELSQSESIDALLERCLAKSRGDRFQSMAELQQAIEAVVPSLNAVPTEIRGAPYAVALGRGFSSDYDGNLATDAPTLDAEPRFASSTPMTFRSARGQAMRWPEPPARMRSLIAIAVAAVVVTLVALERRTDDSDARSAADPPSPQEVSSKASTALVDRPTDVGDSACTESAFEDSRLPRPRTPARWLCTTPVPPLPVAAPITPSLVAPIPPAEPMMPPAGTRPVVIRMAPRARWAPPSKSIEDLYDTR